ncbi:MAG: hypothetical protein WAN70_15460 [Terriglobales bacterium]|jgi:hypothetical protein
MRTRTVLLSVAALFAAAVVCFAAEDANMGTWKLNEAKSKLVAGATKNITVAYEAAGDSVKVTIDGVDAAGKPTHNEWTGKFDGKDYPVTGDATSDTRSYKRVNAHTMTFTVNKGDKVTMTGRIAVAADGKSRTVTASGTDAMGMKQTSSAVYDKR